MRFINPRKALLSQEGGAFLYRSTQRLSARSSENAEAIEEERRLFYVAVTLALRPYKPLLLRGVFFKIGGMVSAAISL